MRRDAAATLAGLALCLTGAGAAAQAPLPFENQDDVDRILNPRPPAYDNPLDKRIREAIKALGLPPQPELDRSGEFRAPPETPGLSDTVMPRLDDNADGLVSRREYLGARQRPRTAGDTDRYVERYRRLRSRFRAADRDRDGTLTAEEIDRMEGRRF